MRAKNVLGLIYSNSHDECISELTARRTMGSVPFGGRYRLIDFTLSSFVNCGITKVGVIANSNFRSLMDHLGSGRPWDLSRKRDGLFILPPFNAVDADKGGDRIAALSRVMDFISSSNEEYILICDTNTVYNMDFSELFEYHTQKNADITVVTNYGKIPHLKNIMVFDCESDGRVKDAAVNPKSEKEAKYSVNTILMRKSLLERLVGDATSYSYESFEKNIIQQNVSKLNVYCYEAQGFCRTIDSKESYFDVNMELLNPDIRADLFNKERPVFTKIRNDMPVKYGLGSNVSNSLISDGCIIDGTVENSVLARGVRVSKGAVVRNCILMQDTFVGDEAGLQCVITDKSAIITPYKTLSGAKTYPIYIGKGIII
ncbi:MAG TPA: glucose-1-phosphate adenylyltransferase subunit GlgD [Oscillospiraceae bacterium]|nr:glucose-1-phosphate adenylyltransferase subunit GlgD [Oscillospiraceae bacterium]